MVDSLFFTLYWKHVAYNSCTSLIWIFVFHFYILGLTSWIWSSLFNWTTKFWEPLKIKLIWGLRSWPMIIPDALVVANLGDLTPCVRGLQAVWAYNNGRGGQCGQCRNRKINNWPRFPAEPSLLLHLTVASARPMKARFSARLPGCPPPPVFNHLGTPQYKNII